MKKDIEWLKRSIDKRIKTIECDEISFVGSEYYDEGYIDGMRDVLYRINQLDEPEVLSQEFINEKAVEVYADTADAEVHVVYRMRDLQNLLVPKQELPVIPKFVADWVETCKEFIDYDGSTINIFDSQHETDTNLPLINTATEKERGKVYDWIADYSEKYARAWLDGYEIEQEPKYVVELPNPNNDKSRYTNTFLNKNKGKVFIDMADLFVDDITQYGQFALTEQEIKDFDERYFQFAVPVEEVNADG